MTKQKATMFFFKQQRKCGTTKQPKYRVQTISFEDKLDAYEYEQMVQLFNEAPLNCCRFI